MPFTSSYLCLITLQVSLLKQLLLDFYFCYCFQSQYHLNKGEWHQNRVKNQPSLSTRSFFISLTVELALNLYITTMNFSYAFFDCSLIISDLFLIFSCFILYNSFFALSKEAQKVSVSSSSKSKLALRNDPPMVFLIPYIIILMFWRVFIEANYVKPFSILYYYSIMVAFHESFVVPLLTTLVFIVSKK